MSVPRSLPSGTMVNGKIYAIGGHRTPKQTATKIVEAYDIATNSWSTCASIPTSRVWHAACALDGKIYVLGGVPVHQRVDTLSPYTLVERYDPTSDTWDTCAPLPTGRMSLSACTVNGKIYAIGGYSKTTTSAVVEVYDPVTDLWSTKQPMNNPRGEMGLTVRRGKIHAICGGMWNGVRITKLYNDFEVYDPESDTWKLNTDLIPRGSLGLAAVTVNDRIYVASGVGLNPHLGVKELYMYDYPLATIKSKPYMEATDSIPALIHEDCRLFIVPEGIPADPDSIIKYQITAWDATDNQEINLVLENIPDGSYLLYAVALDNRIGYDPSQFIIMQDVPEFVVQVIDSNTEEILSGCNIYLNGKRFVKESKEALNLKGWAYDTCSIQIHKASYKAYDTTVVIKSDTTLVINLKYAYPEPELFVYNNPLLDKTDYLEMKLSQHGKIYLTPEGTPAVADSITEYAIDSLYASAEEKVFKLLQFIPPGIYRIFGISNAGRIATYSYVVQVIDHFPECIVQVRDSVSEELIDSCLLVVDGQDTIPGPQGEFDLTGLVYDTCSIIVTREGYNFFDTTLVVLDDTSFVISLVPLNTEIPDGMVESENHKLRIFPNPTQGQITVQTREKGICSLEVITLDGHVLKKMNLSGSSDQVDLSSYQSGVYLIRIIFKDKVYMSRVIKF